MHATYVQEYRPSGTVMRARMSCYCAPVEAAPDPESGYRFPSDKREAFARRSCSTKKT